MSNKAKGWIFVVLQVILVSLIVISSLYETVFLNIAVPGFLNRIGIVLLAGGGIMLIASILNFGQMITPHPVPLERYKFRKHGMYRYVRHPMYFSLLVLMTGTVFFLGGVISIIFVVVLFLLFSRKADFEETFLIQKYPEYISYRKTTSKLIPYIY